MGTEHQVLEDAHRNCGLSEPMVCQALYPDVFNMRQGHLISSDSHEGSGQHQSGRDMMPQTVAGGSIQPSTPLMTAEAIAFSPFEATPAAASMYGTHAWPASVTAFLPAAPMHMHGAPAERIGGPESLASKITRSFRQPSRIGPQAFGESLLPAAQALGYPGSYGKAAMHNSHSYGASQLPAAAPLQLYGPQEALHEAICLVGYSQPLRGKPIESLPAAQVAAYEEAAPAAATPAQEGGPAAAHIPGTPARRSHSANGNGSLLDVQGVEVKVVDEADPQLKAHWQKAALLGSPQLGTPQQVPRAPRGNVHASSQERAISLKLDEEMAPGQDHIYVVFNLPTLDSGRQRTRLLQPGPWGTDLQAASLMGLSGHSYTHKGPAKCQWLFSKCLTASDTNKLSRIILPRQAVDTFLPHVEDRAGLDLEVWDTACICWLFKLKFWMNGSNPKRMYVMENVRDFVALHNLQSGSTLSFYYAPDNRLVVDTWPVEDYFDLPGKP